MDAAGSGGVVGAAGGSCRGVGVSYRLAVGVRRSQTIPHPSLREEWGTRHPGVAAGARYAGGSYE